MGLKQHIPNIVTLASLLAGLIAIPFLFQGRWDFVALCIGTSLLCDFLDGFLARLLRASSELGKQLDSFSDLVSFGVVPGLAVFLQLKQGISTELAMGGVEPLPFLGFLIPLASALRLAKFNLSPPSEKFQGLPTPANALLILSLVLITFYYPDSTIAKWLTFPLSWILVIGISCGLMLYPITLFSLKFSNVSVADNWFRYLFLAISTLGLIFFDFLAIPFVITFYLLLSVSLNLRG